MSFAASSIQTTLVMPFSQGQQKNLVTDPALQKKAAEILDYRLSEHEILNSKTKITFYLDGAEVLNGYFSENNSEIARKLEPIEKN